MTDNCLPNLNSLVETIKKESDPLRQMHAKMVECYQIINQEIQHVREAPPDRQALADFLSDVVDRYCDMLEKEFANRLRVAIDPRALTSTYPGSGDSLADKWMNGLRSGIEPPYWLLVPLLRDTLRAGAYRIAQETEWPETDVESRTRQQRLQTLHGEKKAMAAEIDAVRAELAKVGIDPTI